MTRLIADIPRCYGIDPDEWPALRAAINRAVRACRKDDELEGPLE